MRRLVVLFAIGWILACAGRSLPCLGGPDCCTSEPAQGAPVACGDCCGDDAEKPAPTHEGCPSTTDRACCPQLRPAVASAAAVLPVPDARTVALRLPVPPRLVAPDPREILHVPRLATPAA